jgi:hypothetical protein
LGFDFGWSIKANGLLLSVLGHDLLKVKNHKTLDLGAWKSLPQVLWADSIPEFVPHI